MTHSRWSTVWTDDMKKMLAELWKAGRSITKISLTLSEKFEVAISRSAVVGKARRMKLPSRPPPIIRKAKGAPRHAVRQPAVAPVRQSRVATPKLQAKILTEAAMPLRPAETPERQCKWLCGQVVRPQDRRPGRKRKLLFGPQMPREKYRDPEPVFLRWADVPRCPYEIVDDKPYCDAHCRRAFTNWGVVEGQQSVQGGAE